MAAFIFILSILYIWLAYEVWRAPMVKEGPDDRITWIGPTKRLRDIFKR